MIAGIGVTRGEEPQEAVARLSLPLGLSAAEAELILDVVARVKARRFGGLVIAVSDGRLVEMEVVEKIDRRMLEGL